MTDKYILQDDKGYIAQINVEKNINNNILLAGEDGLISINNKYLPRFIGNSGWLENIEDIWLFDDGDIAVCSTDGDVGVYKYNNGDYILYLLTPHIDDDCLYNIEYINEEEFLVSGEKGIKYKYNKNQIKSNQIK